MNIVKGMHVVSSTPLTKQAQQCTYELQTNSGAVANSFDTESKALTWATDQRTKHGTNAPPLRLIEVTKIISEKELRRV